ncbi:BON domain-containing protein [Cupriavidus basilensis]|jgi:osmotically-inducible protein OsmY|uniref:BON domain-containing protein n=1 Tax=Cupriavidus TaxID=106589 RepID=UPI00044BD6CA|nr:BON domain-containing protein [Cupriavidus basilensis]MDF3888691.1 BON domain-containing protein [Cupriavidus basilensis]
MKSDMQLKQDVCEELEWDPAIRAEGIGVQVSDGVVTLSGQLDSFAAKHAVEEAVRRVSGVGALVVALDVRLSPEDQRPDADIARGIENALLWNAAVPADAIQVTVEHGAVTLTGEVDHGYQRAAAADMVRQVRGVASIANGISVRPMVIPEDLAQRITNALSRQAIADAARLRISVAGGTVTLSGTLRNWAEIRAARETAWSAPGVTQVVDQMMVGP